MPSFAPIPEIRSRFARDCARPEARAAFAAAASAVCASESVRGVANSFSRGGITTTARGGASPPTGGASAQQPPLPPPLLPPSSNEKRKEGARADASASAASRPHITCSTSAAVSATGHTATSSS